jgi:cobalamin biosynthesis Mg chelatase CobN
MSLGTTALASADPSGSEYLPSVPSATGHHASSDAQAGTSQTGGSSATITQDSGTAAPSQSGQPKTHASKDKKAPSASPKPVASTDTTSSDGGSSGLPIILLIVAGVIVAAVGMTLRRRQGGGSDPGAGDANRGDESHTPRTPDGEIVADQHEAA